MELNDNQSPVESTKNLIDINYSIDNTHRSPLSILPQYLDINNILQTSHRDSFDNNPFDRVLKEVQLEYLKKNDPFEIVFDRAYGINKSDSNKSLSMPDNKENVPIICINGNRNLSDKLIDIQEKVECNSKLLITRSPIVKRSTKNSNEKLNGVDFLDVSSPINSFINNSLISSELIDRNILMDSFISTVEDVLTEKNIDGQNLDKLIYSVGNILSPAINSVVKKTLIRDKDDVKITDNLKNMSNTPFENNILQSILNNNEKTKSSLRSISNLSHLEDNISPISPVLDGSLKFFYSKSNLSGNSKSEGNLLDNAFIEHNVQRSFEVSFKKSLNQRLSQSAREINKYDRSNINVESANLNDFDSIYLETDALANTFAKLAVSSDDECSNSDEDLFNLKLPNGALAANEINISSEIISEGDIPLKDELPKNFTSKMVRQKYFDAETEGFACGNLNKEQSDSHRSTEDNPSVEERLNKSDTFNSKKKMSFNRSISVFENLASYGNNKQTDVKNNSAIKLLENITMILKADEQDTKQRKTLGENLINSIVQVLNLDVRNNCKIENDKTENSDDLNENEFDHNSTESIENSSNETNSSDLNPFINSASNKFRNHSFNYGQSSKYSISKKDELNTSKLSRSNSLNNSKKLQSNFNNRSLCKKTLSTEKKAEDNLLPSLKNQPEYNVTSNKNNLNANNSKIKIEKMKNSHISSLSDNITKFKKKLNIADNMPSNENNKRSPLRAILPIGNMMKRKGKKEGTINKEKENIKICQKSSIQKTPPRILSFKEKLTRTQSDETPVSSKSSSSPIFLKSKPVSHSTPNTCLSKGICPISPLARRSIGTTGTLNKSISLPTNSSSALNVMTLHKYINTMKSSKSNLKQDYKQKNSLSTAVPRNDSKLMKSNEHTIATNLRRSFKGAKSETIVDKKCNILMTQSNIKLENKSSYLQENLNKNFKISGNKSKHFNLVSKLCRPKEETSSIKK